MYNSFHLFLSHILWSTCSLLSYVIHYSLAVMYHFKNSSILLRFDEDRVDSSALICAFFLVASQPSLNSLRLFGNGCLVFRRYMLAFAIVSSTSSVIGRPLQGTRQNVQDETIFGPFPPITHPATTGTHGGPEQYLCFQGALLQV